MRKLSALVFVVALTAAAYAVSPLWVAMEVRRAILTGDVAVLETRVNWSSVRQSLKASLSEIERQKQEEAAARNLPRPSLWTRIKAAAAPTNFTDRLIDSYVTPAGVVRLVAARGGVNAVLGKAGGAQADEFMVPDHAQPLVDRAQRFFNRLRRVSILSATAIEIEVADRRIAERSYVGVVTFTDLRWRLTDLRVMGVGF